MNRFVKAAAPTLLSLAQKSKYASLCIDNATTHFEKRAHVINLDSVNSSLVSEALKLGSAVLQSVQASKKEKELEDISKRESDQEEKLSMSLRDGLLTGAAFAAVPALAANYTINRASDDLDAKMVAIPGLAAATVGAILAAKHMNSGKLPSNPPIEELETAINAKQVVDSAIDNTEDTDTLNDLEKMSSISTDHIAGLLTDILV